MSSTAKGTAFEKLVKASVLAPFGVSLALQKKGKTIMRFGSDNIPAKAHLSGHCAGVPKMINPVTNSPSFRRQIW